MKTTARKFHSGRQRTEHPGNPKEDPDMEKYGKYGKAAIRATKLVCDHKIAPREAWYAACEEQFSERQKAAIRKSCPSGAYLGLCEEGKINGVPVGNYTRSRLNKKYALEAVEILRSCQSLESDKPRLWEKVLKKAGVKKAISHNYQLHVVLALWREGFIKRSRP